MHLPQAGYWASNAARKLYISRHDRDAFGMDGAEVAGDKRVQLDGKGAKVSVLTRLRIDEPRKPRLLPEVPARLSFATAACHKDH